MKISNINLNFNKSLIKQQNNAIKSNNQINSFSYSNLPSTKQYLAFLGGYSLNLEETFEQLKDEDYPQDIQEAVLETIYKKNPQNKTLYDIHFEKYKGILDCNSLDELKEQYPEFKDVNSSFSVFPKKDSFISKFQQDNLTLFPIEEDLSLQLIKLYWGRGFSLNDLSKYIAQFDKDKKGINLYYAMEKKLNIPLMNQRYAQVLKLSNKKYNEEFTYELSKKLRESAEIRKQRSEGIPFPIPRGPLSEETRKKISESLKEYYRSNPETIYKRSASLKQFYEQNPQAREEMSIVMDYAWNKTHEGKSVKKYLSKFMQKQCKINDEELIFKKQLTQEQIDFLQKFWDKNPWAKEKISIAIKKGWTHLKEKPIDSFISPLLKSILPNIKNIPGKQIVYSTIPTQIRNSITKWLKNHDLDIDDNIIHKRVLNINNEEICDEKTKKEIQEIANFLSILLINPQENLQNMIATTYQSAFVEIASKINNPVVAKIPKIIRNNPNKLNEFISIFTALTKSLYTIKNNMLYIIPGVEMNKLLTIQDELIFWGLENGCEQEIAKMIQDYVDETFGILIKNKEVKLY